MRASTTPEASKASSSKDKGLAAMTAIDGGYKRGAGVKVLECTNQVTSFQPHSPSTARVWRTLMARRIASLILAYRTLSINLAIPTI